MAQIYNDRKRGVKSGFAKYETFPVWNLSGDHPVNIAYEAATADIGDHNIIDPFHLKAYGITAVNYTRDVENFKIMKQLIDTMVDKGDPLKTIRSPTDMGVNLIKEGIVDDEIVREASKQEIVRRYFRYQREFVEGETFYETLKRIETIMQRVGVKPEDRSVVLPARKAAEEAEKKKDVEKGYKGVFCGAAIEITHNSNQPLIVTGKNSPLLYAESAAILNALKILAEIPDHVKVITSNVLRNIVGLKNKIGLNNTSLDIKEVLSALASSAVIDKNAHNCLDVLNLLKGCEMHTTHIINESNEKLLKQVGLILTTDAKIPIPNY
jgi:uncharacterized protein (UPF0371 family)